MIGLSILGVIGNSGFQSPLWFKANKIEKLVFRADREGCSYISGSTVFNLDATAKVQKKFTVPKNMIPLFVSGKSALQFIRNVSIMKTSGDKLSENFEIIAPRAFAQRDVLFQSFGTLSFRYGSWWGAFDNYDRFAAAGVSSDRTHVYLMTLDKTGEAARIESFGLEGGATTKRLDTRTLTLKVGGVPYCIPGFNDLLILEGKYALYIGKGGQRSSKTGALNSASTIDLSDFMLDDSGDKTECYMMVSRLSDGLTVPFCKFSISDVGEPRGPRENRVVQSVSGKYIYVLSNRGILRFSSEHILKSVKF